MSTSSHTLKYLLLCTALFVLSGCNATNGGGKYRIAVLKGPSAMGMIQMIDSLAHTENGRFEVSIYSEPMQVRKEMITGAVDFAALPMTMGALSYNKGIDYRLTAMPVSGSLYLVGNGVDNWDDLRGGRVNMMAKGMTPDILFRYLLQENGLKPDKEVILDYSFPSHTDLANALSAGLATLGVITEPYVSMVLQKNPQLKVLLSLDDEWNRLQGTPISETAFLVKGAFAKSHPEVVKEVVDAYRHSSLWVNTHLDSAARLVAKYQIVEDDATARIAIPRSNLKFSDISGHQKAIEAYLRIFYEMSPEVIGGKMPDIDFYYEIDN